MSMELKEFLIEKLTSLKIKAEFENRKKGKIKYVSVTSVYQDLIKLLKEFEWEEQNDNK